MPQRSSALRWRWMRWRGLSPAEKRSFLTAWGMFPLIALSLRALGYGRTYALLARGEYKIVDNTSQVSETCEVCEQISKMTRLAVQNTLIRPTCLVRSLTLWWLLRRRGIESGLRIGVRMREGKMEAHAWVERAGRVLNDAPDIGKQYAAFDRLLLPSKVVWR